MEGRRYQKIYDLGGNPVFSKCPRGLRKLHPLVPGKRCLERGQSLGTSSSTWGMDFLRAGFSRLSAAFQILEFQKSRKKIWMSKIMVSGPLVSIFGVPTSICSLSTKKQPIWLQGLVSEGTGCRPRPVVIFGLPMTNCQLFPQNPANLDASRPKKWHSLVLGGRC